MGGKTKIEWAHATWNPVTGCAKISPGCKHCYAERMTKRLQAMGIEKYSQGFRVTLHLGALQEPLKWKKPRRVFVCSMGDLFHEDVPLYFIRAVFDTMRGAKQHRFLLLTKRPWRLRELLGRRVVLPSNVWTGVSIERNAYCWRVDQLRGTSRFISFEPLLGRIRCIKMLLPDIDWVIVGGETGPGARPMRKEWVEEILDACQEAGKPFFFKQWGGVNKKATGRELRGRTWDEMPEGLRLDVETVEREKGGQPTDGSRW